MVSSRLESNIIVQYAAFACARFELKGIYAVTVPPALLACVTPSLVHAANDKEGALLSAKRQHSTLSGIPSTVS